MKPQNLILMPPIFSPPAIEPCRPVDTPQDREARLREFIRWALQQSRSGQYLPCQAMQLLSSAWEAQKLLWHLQTQSIEDEQPATEKANHNLHSV
jgi:hypothetical protein